jgi:hypothetical protein
MHCGKRCDFIICRRILLIQSLRSVFESPLANSIVTSNVSDLSGITIKFVVASAPRDAPNAEEFQAQAVHAITEATEDINALATPATVGLLGSAVNAESQVLNTVNMFDNVWGGLLERIELFNTIVAGIAEVFCCSVSTPCDLMAIQIHPYASLAWSVISAATRVRLVISLLSNCSSCCTQVLVDQKNRDKRIIQLAATMKDVFSFLDDAEPLKAINTHIRTMTLLLQQVTECAFFITGYAKQKDFCQSSSNPRLLFLLIRLSRDSDGEIHAL